LGLSSFKLKFLAMSLAMVMATTREETASSA